MDYLHRTDIQIRFNDIDRLGHVYNGIFSHYFDLARMEYFREVFGKEPDWKKFAMVMASLNMDFKTPVYPGEQISVLSKTELIGDKSLTMVQEVVSLPGFTTRVFGRSVMVGYSPEEKVSVVIPDEIRKKILGFEKNVRIKSLKDQS